MGSVEQQTITLPAAGSEIAKAPGPGVTAVSDEAGRARFLDELGLEAGDLAWAQRLGQIGRMAISRKQLRAVTWLSDGVSVGLIIGWCKRRGLI